MHINSSGGVPYNTVDELACGPYARLNPYLWFLAKDKREG